MYWPCQRGYLFAGVVSVHAWQVRGSRFKVVCRHGQLLLHMYAYIYRLHILEFLNI